MTWLRVLSPNLGCPLLLEGKESLRIVCAWPGPGLPDRDDLREAFVLETARSYLRVTRAPARRVALEPAGPPRVLQDWQAAGFVAAAEETRRLLPRVVMD